MLKLHAVVKSGKLQFTGTRAWVRMRISELQDGEWDVVFRRHFKKRSLKLNNYYWGVVVLMVFEALRDQGYADEIREPEDAHEFLKGMFFKRLAHSDVHGDIEIVSSTTKFNNIEFNERLEQIWAWAQTFLGIYIPPPNSQAALDFEGNH